MTLLLPWFPIMLSVGVGGRLLGKTRGVGIGILCAMFWVVLVQAGLGVSVAGDPWTLASLLAGAVAIVAMGAWAGGMPLAPRAPDRIIPEDAPSVITSNGVSEPQDHKTAMQRVSAAFDRYDDWLDAHRSDANPWPAFGEFLHGMLYECCDATHAKPYRLLSEGDEMLPLREPDPFTEVESVSARRGILGHVVTTGRSFIVGDDTQGELVGQLAHESSDQLVWCFPIVQGTRRLGAITIGRIGIAPRQHRPLLGAVERMVRHFWCTLEEVCKSRAATLDDPVSGLYTREAFLRVAEQSLAESYAQGEPVAVVVVALERLRELNDSGQWELADELIAQVSDTLRRKVRLDDRLGRFDGSRMVLLLRRVDSELASLIVAQMMARLAALCGDQKRWRIPVTVRCGVAGSGTEQPDLRTLLAQALSQCHRARREATRIASDLEAATVATGAVS